jgi:hypothetical protein
LKGKSTVDRSGKTNKNQRSDFAKIWGKWHPLENGATADWGRIFDAEPWQREDWEQSLNLQIFWRRDRSEYF